MIRGADMVSAGQLQQITDCTPKLAAIYAPLINRFASKYEIDSARRLGMFIAQVAHESGSFSRLVENLNYSAGGLMGTWPNRYNSVTANQHHRKPELIANHVYGMRMGNTNRGDGWRYIGRGLIQLTGFDNYFAFERATHHPVTTDPTLLQDPVVAVESACWYWQANGLNRYADNGDLKGCTQRINGGLNGLADRERLYAKAREVLSWD